MIPEHDPRRTLSVGIRTGMATVVLAAVGSLTPVPVSHGAAPDPLRVARDDIASVMRQEARKGYNLRVVTNASRLSTAVLLSLSRAARTEASSGQPLLLHHDDWFRAYQAVTRLPSPAIPEFIALQRDYRQDQVIEWDPSAVVYEVKKGRTPKMVIRVTASWPDGKDVPDHYAFVDTIPDPDMRVVNERHISYYLLDFGDMVVQDDIHGIAGRPIEGALGAVFNVIGDGEAVQSRFAFAEDGLMVTYATARKGLITVNPISTTLLDGTMIDGIPDDRPDLEAIVDRLKEKLEIVYPE